MAADDLAGVEEPILLEEEEPVDTAVALTSGLVIATFVVLLVAHVVAQKVLATLFGVGLFA